jgi:5'-3' exonuclease
MTQAIHYESVPTVTPPKSLVLVDLSYLFRRDWHALEGIEEVNVAARSTLQTVHRLRETAEHLIVAIDMPPYDRKKVFPAYKANRERPSDGLLAQFKWLRDRLTVDGIQVAGAQGYEADDVIATLADAYATMGVKDIRIVGADKDLAQLVGGPVRQCIPARGDETRPESYQPEQLLDEAGVYAKHQVPPNQIVDYLALLGDKSDNLPGCPKCGPVTASELVRKFGDLDAVMAAAKAGNEAIKPAIRKNLVDNEEAIRTSRKLIVLRTDAPLDLLGLLEKLEPQPIVGEPVERGTREPGDDSEDDDVAELIVQSAPAEPSRLRPMKEPAPVEQTAIVPAQPANDISKYGQVDGNMQPQDLRAVRSLAHWAVNSRVFPKHTSIDTATVIILRGRELGLSAMSALDALFMIDGKLGCYADVIQALAEQDPNCEYFQCIETEDDYCVYETKHRKHAKPTTMRFTMAQAQQAGLSRGQNYQKHPADMLRARCKAKLARMVYPGKVRGLYCPEEL